MNTIKVGCKVNYHSVIGEKTTSYNHIVKKIIYKPNNFGTDIAFITNKFGCVALASLSKAEE